MKPSIELEKLQIQIVGLLSIIVTGTLPTKSPIGDLNEFDSNMTLEVRLPLPVQEKGFALAASVSCPTSRCYCQLDSRINRYIINCRHQKLAKIPAFTAVNTRFYEISFSMNNHITEIPTFAFRNLKVERIDLLKNSLVSILPGAFDGVEAYLKELLIEGNGNIAPPYSKLLKLANLRTLRLQKFQQYSIEKDNYFDRFPNLEVLELYNFVSLTSIDGQAFQNKLPKLKRLEIINSHLTNVPVQSLIYLPSLQKLYIKDSQITTIYSRSFERLLNLTDLDLSYNKITTLETDAFLGIEDHLESITLTFNEITPESMIALSGKTWSNLEQLTMSYNTKLGAMPDRSFETMPKLQYLNLVKINLRKVSTNFFSGLTNLHTLDLSWNKIGNIEAGAFEHMSSLYELKLNRQFGQSDVPQDFAMQISYQAFHGLENSLAVFNLQDTPIVPQQFWNIVRTLPNLQTLKLSKTRLSKIPDFGFVYNKKLKDIELEGNNIGVLTPDSFTGPNDSLMRVLLSSNKLSSISNCIFDKHTNLEAICLAQNPLTCNCDLFWLYKFISRQTEPIGPCFNFDYICATPKQYESQALFTLPLKKTCSSFIPKECIHEQYTTPHSTENPVTKLTEETDGVTKPTVATTTTMTKKPNEITLTIVGKTVNSITIAWSIKHKANVTGFILEYHATTDKAITTENMHRDKFLHTINNLKGKFYTMCIIAEINQVRNDKFNACRTAQTENKGTEETDRVTKPTVATNTTTTMTKKPNEIILTIAGKTVNSITIAWSIKHKADVTGFILEYHATTDKATTTENMHRDTFLHTIHNLKGKFYTICIIPEINQVRNDKVKSCRTAQTENKGTYTEKQSDDRNNARNVLIGAILGTVVVIILVVTGLYLIVKYKLQKLKTLRLTLNHLQNNIDRELGRRGDNQGCGKVSAVSNEYIEMEEMKKAKQYHMIEQTSAGKHLQRQYGVDTTEVNGVDTTEVNNDYTRECMHAYERDKNSAEDKDNGYSKVSKVELEQRHSAPSRLNAEDLMRNRSVKCATRPLPATPETEYGSVDNIRPSTAAHVITTQVSVYEHKERESVYHELP